MPWPTREETREEARREMLRDEDERHNGPQVPFTRVPKCLANNLPKPYPAVPFSELCKIAQGIRAKSKSHDRDYDYIRASQQAAKETKKRRGRL